MCKSSYKWLQMTLYLYNKTNLLRTFGVQVQIFTRGLPITIFQINFQIKSAEENSHPASSRGRGQEEACAGCHTDALKYEIYSRPKVDGEPFTIITNNNLVCIAITTTTWETFQYQQHSQQNLLNQKQQPGLYCNNSIRNNIRNISKQQH